jgi:predicted ATPase/transcriptional regulator with XRE-family HTH domain
MAMQQRATTFGEQLRQFRLRVGLSQAALAEQANLSAAAVASLERGARNAPYPRTLDALARALELSPQEKADLMAAGTRAARPRPADPPSAKQPVSDVTQVPTWLTSLVGRATDVDRVRSLLRPSGSAARLLTLLGPGGVGKTRLACAAAVGLAEDFPDGIVFVDLAPLRDARLVPVTIARALDVRENGRGSARELLLGYLSERRILLVLDNFEHLLEAAPVVTELVSRCPRLAVLLTSRTALRVQGELRYAVTPLAVPGTTVATGGPALTEWPAVQLFTERAQAVAPDFAVQPNQASTIASICRRLDGMPLAIELAAARVPLLSPEALLRRLERPFPLLTAGTRDRPSRQQTLRNTLAWSYELLDPPGQKLFRRLAVFVGGWTLEAAEAVCAGTDLPAEAVLDRLHLLVESSLVQVLDNGGGERRFRLLETVREYAEEQSIDNGEAPTMRARHCDWYVAWAERIPADLFDPAHVQALGQEYANLRSAFERSVAAGDAGRAFRLALGGYPLWYVRAYYGEGRAWFRDVLGMPPAAQPSPLRIRALVWAGNLAYCQGDYPAALALIEASRAEAQVHGDEQGVAIALYYRAHVERVQGNVAAAQALYTEALDRNRHLGNRYWEAQALLNIAMLAGEQDDPDRAVALVRECLPILRGVGAWSTARALKAPALAATPAKEIDTVRRWLAESVALERHMGDDSGLSWSLLALARYARLDGDVVQAGRLLEEAVQLAHRSGDRLGLARSLEGVAALVATETPQLAVGLAGAADALREALGARLLPAEHVRFRHWQAAARQALGEEPYAKAWTLGRRQTLGLAVADALRAVTADADQPAVAPA